MDIQPKEIVDPTLYLFLDEGGNFDFSTSGSRYFSISCVSMYRPFVLHTALDTYKYDLIEHRIRPRIDLEYFHCADDNRHVRKKLFSMLLSELDKGCVDAVVVEKPKTGPALRPPEKFYPKMLGYLLRYAVQRSSTFGELVVITDSIPVKKKRRAVEKAVKETLSEMLPSEVPYRIMHHASRAHYGLQVADYLNWALFRKWEHEDDSSYMSIKPLIRSEFDIFRTGKTYYY